VWGTDFLLSFFNALHREHPYADKLKPTLLLAYHAIKNGWIPATALVRLIVFLKRRGVAWRGIASTVLDHSDVSLLSLVGAFEDEEWRTMANQVVRANPEQFTEAIGGLDQADRAILKLPKTIALEAQMEADDERANTLGLVRDSREVRGARDRLSRSGVTNVVFGHTHQVVDGDLDGTHFNPGCWIPHLNLRNEDVRAKVQRGGLTRELLSDSSLYRIEPYAVMIRPQYHRSHVELVDIT
jgi:predicted phosphodiesterase